MPPPNGTVKDAKKFSGIKKATAGANSNSRKRVNTQNKIDTQNFAPKAPSSKLGWLSAAANPMASLAKSVGSSFWDQRKYGMNDRAMRNYNNQQAVYDIGGEGQNPANMTPEQRVQMARQAQLSEQLPHAMNDRQRQDAGLPPMARNMGPDSLIIDPRAVPLGEQRLSGGMLVPVGGPVLPPTERPPWAPPIDGGGGGTPQPPWAPQPPSGTPPSWAPEAYAPEAPTSAPVDVPSLFTASPQPAAVAPPQGAAIPTGNPDAGTFKPVTFRSGTGTSTADEDGMTTSLAEPYSGLSSLVGEGTGLLGAAGVQSQQAPNQVDTSFNTNDRAQQLMSQRSALLEPQFAQQRAQAQESMFGSGRLGLRLSGEGVGAGEGSMVQPDAFGMNQAQSQAMAQLAAQSSQDAFGEGMQRAGMDLNQFSANQGAQQQQFGNMMGAGQGMLQAGMQGASLEQSMAAQQMAAQQQAQNYGLAQQNFGLAQRGQAQDYGLNQAQFGLAQQGQDQSYGLNQQNFSLAARGQAQDYNQRQAAQDQNYGLQRQQQLQDYGISQQRNDLAQQQQRQDYGFGQQNYGLARQQQLQDYGFNQQNFGLQNKTVDQNYLLGKEQNDIARMIGQSTVNKNNYQPDPWLTGITGIASGFFGSSGGSGWLSDFLRGNT